MNILSNTSFRIPTSGHISLSEIEIVGILPKELGDLMIINESLITQKGIDFDVDKEYLYSLNTFIDSENKIRILDKKSKNKIVEKFKNDLALLKKEDDIFSIFNNTDFGKDILGFINEDIIKTQKDLNKFLHNYYNNKIEEKILENEILKIYSSVLSNIDMQENIMRPLNMDFAKSQADLLSDNIRDNDLWSMLDDEHQKFKMRLGSSGKMAIGVYSNMLTFHSLLNQYYNNIEDSKNLYGKKYINKPNNIPNEIWEDIKNTTIAESFEERQNTATDNEKEQILGKVHVNQYTIGIDSILTLQGNIKDFVEIRESEYNEDNKNDYKINNRYYRVISYPYFFISQPIIKEYIKRIQNKTSTIEEFSKNIKKKIADELLETTGVLNKKEEEIDYSILTGQVLYDSLNDNNLDDNLIQGIILKKFLELEKENKNITSFNKYLSINKDGIGKSFFDTLDKKEFLVSSINSPYKDLIGDYEISETIIKDNNYIYIDEVEDGYLYIKPTTPIGKMLVESVMTGYNMWNKFLPYDSTIIKKSFNNIMKNLSNEETSPDRKIELNQMIMKEFKKFIFSSKALGLYDNDIISERIRLLFDKEDEKVSLATYLRDNIRNIDTLKYNPLLKSFTFENSQKGLIIKFNNSKMEDFDEDYLYNSLNDLIINNKELPNFNNEEYNTSKLALDLVSYSYITGGIQEAIQFIKYIPNEILESTSFSKTLKKWNYLLLNSDNILDEMNNRSLNLIKQKVTEFEEQFIQHNPGLLLEKLSLDDINNTTDKKYEDKVLISFKYNTSSKYISIYNPYIKKGLNKYLLFKKNGNRYERISTLGIDFINEYNISSKPISLFNDIFIIEKEKLNTNKVLDNKKLPEDTNVEEFTKYILDNNLIKDDFIYNIYKTLLDNNLIDKNITVKFADLENSKGIYDDNNKTIVIKQELLDSRKDELAKTFIKEVIHSITVHEIKKYLDKDGNILINNVATDSLSILFKEFKKGIKQEDLETVLEKRKNRKPLTSNEKIFIYPAVNILEFVEVFFTEKQLQDKFKEVPYLESGKSFYQKFIEIINKILQNLTNNNFTTQVVSNILEIIENNSKSIENNFDKITSENPDIMYNENYSKINSLEEQKQLELKKAEEDWAVNVDERGYPKESLQSILEKIEAKYKQLENKNTYNDLETVNISDILAEKLRNGEIEYRDEEGKPCAKIGGKNSNFTKGSQWEIVKDLKGYPSHTQGGVNITLGKNGFSFKRKDGNIKAAYGLILPKIK